MLLLEYRIFLLLRTLVFLEVTHNAKFASASLCCCCSCCDLLKILFFILCRLSMTLSQIGHTCASNLASLLRFPHIHEGRFPSYLIDSFITFALSCRLIGWMRIVMPFFRLQVNVLDTSGFGLLVFLMSSSLGSCLTPFQVSCGYPVRHVVLVL